MDPTSRHRLSVAVLLLAAASAFADPPPDFSADVEQAVKKSVSELSTIKHAAAPDPFRWDGQRCVNKAGWEGRNKFNAKDLKAGVDAECADLKGAEVAGEYKVFEADKRLNLKAAKFRGALLEESLWSLVDCPSCDFTGAVLKKAKIHHVDLNNAVFTGANLQEAILAHATMIEGSLTKADFLKAYLCDVDLTKASAEGANFYAVRTHKVKPGLPGVPYSTWTDKGIEQKMPPGYDSFCDKMKHNLH